MRFLLRKLFQWVRPASQGGTSRDWFEPDIVLLPEGERTHDSMMTLVGYNRGGDNAFYAEYEPGDFSGYV
jgi:hypothetical protein